MLHKPNEKDKKERKDHTFTVDFDFLTPVTMKQIYHKEIYFTQFCLYLKASAKRLDFSLNSDFRFTPFGEQL